MRYTASLHGKTIFFDCDDGLRETAAFFASILRQEDRTHHILHPGHTLQIGWGAYRVLPAEGGCQLAACDLLRDPFREVTTDLSLSLELFAGQRRILSATKAPPVETTFQDTLVLHRAALTAPKVYLLRDTPTTPGDSGWYMGALGVKAPQEPSAYRKLYTYQLLPICKEAISVLQLPVGTIAVFEAGQLIEIVDGQNNKLY